MGNITVLKLFWLATYSTEETFHHSPLYPKGDPPCEIHDKKSIVDLRVFFELFVPQLQILESTNTNFHQLINASINQSTSSQQPVVSIQ